MAGQRRLDIEEVGAVTVARFIDKKILDENNIQIIGNQLFGLVDEDHRMKIVLDFTNVDYLSSAALGKLIQMDKKVKTDKGKSPYGVMHMSGNVWQWCEGEDEYRPGLHVLGGGSWYNYNSQFFCSSYRNYYDPDFRDYNLSFRCASGQ